MKIIEDKKYMQYYWDLASENLSQRVTAAYELISYVQNLEKHRKSNDSSQSQKEYLDYSLKRLIRGLGSPRDHARQGFAITFSEIIRVFEIKAEDCLKLIDENLQISGSSKGSEERDIMFGKLFAYVGMIRAGLLRKNDSISQEIISRLIVLHNKKNWLQELTIEAILSLLTLADSSLQEHILFKTEVVYNHSLSEMTVNQLLYFVGLQLLAKNHSSFRKLWKSVLESKQLSSFDLHQLDQVVEPLLTSSKKFPKIHRIWDYLLGFVVPLTVEREIIQRDEEFTSEQHSNLQLIIDFMDVHLWRATKEKRALAMKLSVKMMEIIPAEMIPVIVSESMVKSIYAARTKKNNLLYDYVAGILQELVASVEKSNARILALISAFTQIGGATFDSRTNTNTIQTLVKAMDSETIHQYFALLCSFVGKEDVKEVKTEAMETEENLEEEAMEEEKKEIVMLHPAVESLQSMMALSKHSNLENPTTILLPTVSILLRLAGFGSGQTNIPSSDDSSSQKKKKDKKDKKNKKKESEHEESSEISSNVRQAIDAVQLLEASFIKEEPSELIIPEEVKLFAREHVLSFLASCLGRLMATVHSKHHKSEAKSGNNHQSTTITFTKDLWVLIGQFFHSQLVIQHHSTLADTELLLSEYYQLVNRSMETFVRMTTDSTIIASISTEKRAAAVKFGENASNLLLTIFCALLIGYEMDGETLLELPGILTRFFEEKVLLGKTQESASEDEEEEEEEGLEVKLLDLSIELLSINNEQSLKGVREIMKRLWNNIFGLIEEESISQSFFDLLIESVLPADTKDSEEGNEMMEAPEESDEEMDDSEGEEETEAGKKRKRNTTSKHASTKKNKQNDGKARADVHNPEEDAEDEEDIEIGEEDMLDLLLTEEDGEEILAKLRDLSNSHAHAGEDEEDDDDEKLDEEEREALLHIEEADDALVKMMRLKQENRKRGIMNMKRQQFLLKSRLLDILEVCIHRMKSSTILFSFFLPLVKAYQYCLSSKMIAEIPEGVAFTQRLSQLILQEYCKKKINLPLEDETQEEVIQEFQEEIQELLATFGKLLISRNSVLKGFSQECFLFFMKMIISNLPLLSLTHQQTICEWIFQFMTHLLQHYYYHRSVHTSQQKPQLSHRLLEDLFLHRYASFFLHYQWEENQATAEEVEEGQQKSNHKKKQNPKKKPELKKVYVIFSHLLQQGLLASSTFSKKLKVMELINQMIRKELSSVGGMKGEEKPLTNQHTSVVELRSFLKQSYVSDCLQSYLQEIQNINQHLTENLHPQKGEGLDEKERKRMKKWKKEYDTKNMRSFFLLLLTHCQTLSELPLSDHRQVSDRLIDELNRLLSTCQSSNRTDKISPVLIQGIEDVITQLKQVQEEDVEDRMIIETEEITNEPEEKSKKTPKKKDKKRKAEVL